MHDLAAFPLQCKRGCQCIQDEVAVQGGKSNKESHVLVAADLVRIV